MGRTWIPEAFRSPRSTLKRQFEKLRDLMADESTQTKEMLDIYRRSLEGKAGRDERKRANAQFADLLRITGLGAFFVMVPGSVILIPIMVKAAGKVGVRLLPDTFHAQNPELVFEDAKGYLQWWANKHNARKTPMTLVVEDATIEVDPGVFNPCPTESVSTALLLNQLDAVEGQRVLDIGCGTGVVALHAGLAGAHHVIAADNDPLAVANAQRNIDAHDLQGTVAAVQSNVFGALNDQLFDCILANLPVSESTWQVNEPDVLGRFIEQAPAFLNTGGHAVLVWASFGNVADVQPRLDDHGWARVVSHEQFGQTWWVESFTL
jgi:methylase of polypeptide subunit release factors